MNTRLHLETPDGPTDISLAPADAQLPLSALLAHRGHPLNTRCGGRGLCGGCEVGLRAGALQRTTDGASVAPGAGDRLRSCQLRLPEGGEATVTVPARSLLKHEPSVVAEFKINVPWANDPLDPAARIGAAVDIGTTTVALLLTELATGKVVGEASAFNAQIRFGEDVLTRIQMCFQNPEGVRQLQRAVTVETIQPLLVEACAEAGIEVGAVGVMAVAANTTMQHLLAGVDPSPLGVHPFSPVFLEHRTYAPAELGLAFGGAGAKVHLLPGPAAYVGADLAAGLIATGMLYHEGPVLLVDVGTNGEIIAKVGDRLVGCATAAGPAFEGAGLTSGTRGVKGAIERITLRGDPYAADLGVIGGGPRPIGICGSAYVDFLWEGRRSGIVQTTAAWRRTSCSARAPASRPTNTAASCSCMRTGRRARCGSPRWTSPGCCRPRLPSPPASTPCWNCWAPRPPTSKPSTSPAASGCTSPWSTPSAAASSPASRPPRSRSWATPRSRAPSSPSATAASWRKCRRPAPAWNPSSSTCSPASRTPTSTN